MTLFTVQDALYERSLSFTFCMILMILFPSPLIIDVLFFSSILLYYFICFFYLSMTKVKVEMPEGILKKILLILQFRLCAGCSS